eukprot:3951456-Pleurochrysis_carterae.AAC.2
MRDDGTNEVTAIVFCNEKEKQRFCYSTDYAACLPAACTYAPENTRKWFGLLTHRMPIEASCINAAY